MADRPLDRLERRWHAEDAAAVLSSLHSSPYGLSQGEAENRLLEWGPNELKETKRAGALQLFFGQFFSLVVWLLLAAAVVAGLLGEWTDSVAIFAIVILNALIGFIQEYKAEAAMAALKKLAAPQAKVWRDGKAMKISARGLVPGDVLLLEAGDRVPADARLLEAFALRCVESSLTGESEPVEKSAGARLAAELPLGDRSNMVFLGTHVVAGTAQAVVTATGMRTEFGKIAGLLAAAGAEEKTPMQSRLQEVGRLLVWASLALVGVIFLLGWIRRLPPVQLLMTSVSLAVAAVPEGLPAVVTVALALGVQRMARRRALVRRLPAVETLGSTNVICTDKTGTLTLGEMTVRRLVVGGENFQVSGEGYSPRGEVRREGKVPEGWEQEALRLLATLFAGCNTAQLTEEKGKWEVIGDPTEGALRAAALRTDPMVYSVDADYPKRREFPFDSERKRMSVLRNMPGEGLRSFVKGAPDVLLARSARIWTPQGIRPLAPADREDLLRQFAGQARSGLRLLAAAYRDFPEEGSDAVLEDDCERELTFVGFAGMQDPPRPEAKAAVARCQEAGIKVVMITGDHPQTAKAIAEELGISRAEDRVVTGVELSAWAEGTLAAEVETISVYARVSAEHKLKVVHAWREAGAVIAMTGDGVNDAPAIKAADIGIAMGKTGTEVTREASDMVITDDNFASIAAAVEEGRGIFDNIRKTLQYLLAGNTGELLLMAVGILGGFPIPLLPIHLLWINLVTDGLPAISLATGPIDPDLMKQPPRSKAARMTDSKFFGAMFVTGCLTAGVALAAFFHGLKTGDVERARTQAFAVLVYAELFRSFGARSATKTLWQLGFRSNWQLVLIVVSTAFLQPWSHHVPALQSFFKVTEMSVAECLFWLGIGLFPLFIMELWKVLKIKAMPHLWAKTRG